MRSAGDGLAVFGARLADESLHVDQAGRENGAGAINQPRAFRRAVAGERRPEIDDLALPGVETATRLHPRFAPASLVVLAPGASVFRVSCYD